MISDLFGHTAIAKVLDFLVEVPSFDFSKAELAKAAELNWRTVNQVFPVLVDMKLVIPTRRIGRAQMYKLNAENPIFQELRKLDLEVSKPINERIAQEGS